MEILKISKEIFDTILFTIVVLLLLVFIISTMTIYILIVLPFKYVKSIGRKVREALNT